MRRQWAFGALIVCVMSSSSGAWAATSAFVGAATLVNAVAAAQELQVEGVIWHCTGDSCVGKAETRSSLNSFVKDCRKVAEIVGPLAAYTGNGRTATKGEIRACNRLAGK